jgi:hypothetical protein
MMPARWSARGCQVGGQTDPFFDTGPGAAQLGDLRHEAGEGMRQ